MNRRLQMYKRNENWYFHIFSCSTTTTPLFSRRQSEVCTYTKQSSLPSSPRKKREKKNSQTREILGPTTTTNIYFYGHYRPKCQPLFACITTPKHKHDQQGVLGRVDITQASFPACFKDNCVHHFTRIDRLSIVNSSEPT